MVHYLLDLPSILEFTKEKIIQLIFYSIIVLFYNMRAIVTKSREKVQLLKYLTNLPVVRDQYRHPYIPDKQNLYTQSYLARVPNLVF